MSIISELAQICEDAWITRNISPTKAQLPQSKYEQLITEFKGMMRIPEPETVIGEDGYWRRETSEEYSERINRPLSSVTLTLTTGTLVVIPYNGSEIEVFFETD